MSSSFLLRSCLLTSAVLISVAITGCAADTDSEDEGTGETASELQQRRGNGPGGGQGGGRGSHGRPHRGGRGAGQHKGGGGHFGRPGPQQITAPQGVFFANIKANGSGCPDGTWDVGISEDGQTFTLAFSAYESTVEPGQAFDIKECTLDIDLNSPEGLSYSVGSFYYQGYTLLDTPGMSAGQTASYFFGRERENNESQNEIKGPVDQSYLFADDIGMARRAWSPCRRDDTLHVKTRIGVKNTPDAAGSGYINNSTVDGSLSFKWNLNWRRCRP